MNKIGLNLKLLNSFEVSVVVMIVLGFLIVGLIVFASLAPKQQSAMASGLEIFDLHQQVSEVTAQVESLINAPSRMMDRFYLAFTQIASYPIISSPDDRSFSFTAFTKDLLYRVS